MPLCCTVQPSAPQPDHRPGVEVESWGRTRPGWVGVLNRQRRKSTLDIDDILRPAGVGMLAPESSKPGCTHGDGRVSEQILSTTKWRRAVLCLVDRDGQETASQVRRSVRPAASTQQNRESRVLTGDPGSSEPGSQASVDSSVDAHPPGGRDTPPLPFPAFHCFQAVLPNTSRSVFPSAGRRVHTGLPRGDGTCRTLQYQPEPAHSTSP
ncbi:hypothetical protein QBC39DRAFT_341952 [Podospora conica]|nr:hypothetical protein QBC39DRAFT_341952 [Schizothecium conicum]